MTTELRDKNNAWFEEQPDESHITSAARKLLEYYSDIPSEEVVDHVVRVRDEAWQIFRYPGIGQSRFLDLSLSQFAEYIELGYKLFRDQNTLQTKFLTADIFDEESALTELRDQFDKVYAGSFFHLFGYDDQFRVSKAVASLLRPQKGSMILRRQIGSVTAAEHDHRTNPTGNMYRHNVQSLQKLWKDIGDETGASFSVNATLQPLQDDHFRFHIQDTKCIWFVIGRG